MPDEILSRPLTKGERFYCVKDLAFHIAGVEDFWVHENIPREKLVLEPFPILKYFGEGSFYAGYTLETLLDYWRAVKQSTLAYLAPLTDGERNRVMSPHDAPECRFTVDGVLRHVMIHEMRHTAQIAVLLLRVSNRLCSI